MARAIPWTYEPRPDTRTTNVRLGMWLFLASETMFFGSLFSAYVLLRAGSATWAPADEWLNTPLLAMLTMLLVVTSVAARRWMPVSVIAGTVFLAVKGVELWRVLGSQWHPATNLTAACWFVLTGLHWLHVAGGVAAGIWVYRGAARVGAAHQAERTHALLLYWMFVDLVWFAILTAFFI